MKITNPETGVPVSVGDLVLEVGQTKDFKQSDAEYLLKTFGFLAVAGESGSNATEVEPKKKGRPARGKGEGK